MASRSGSRSSSRSGSLEKKNSSRSASLGSRNASLGSRNASLDSKSSSLGSRSASLEYVPVASSNHIVFTIARMNPPTSGHMKVIEKLIETALKNGQTKAYILLASGEGTGKEQKNPLTCLEKRDLLKDGMIEGVKKIFNPDTPVEIEIMCGEDISGYMEPCNDSVPQRWILNHLCQIKKKNGFNYDTPITLHLVIGSDRKDAYNWLKKAPYQLLDLIVVERPKNNIGISGTKVRELAKKGNKEEFKEFMEKETDAGLSEAAAKRLFDLLHHRMNTLPKIFTKKKTDTSHRVSKTKKSKSVRAPKPKDKSATGKSATGKSAKKSKSATDKSAKKSKSAVVPEATVPEVTVPEVTVPEAKSKSATSKSATSKSAKKSKSAAVSEAKPVLRRSTRNTSVELPPPVYKEEDEEDEEEEKEGGNKTKKRRGRKTRRIHKRTKRRNMKKNSI